MESCGESEIESACLKQLISCCCGKSWGCSLDVFYDCGFTLVILLEQKVSFVRTSSNIIFSHGDWGSCAMDFDIEVPKRETSSDATPFELCSEDTMYMVHSTDVVSTN